jgi:hypothetical protein
MVLNMCRCNCKTDLAKGAYYNMKINVVQSSGITVNIKNLEQKISNLRYNKNFNQKISYWYNDIFIIATVIFGWNMNQWCHFQISYFIKNQNVMKQLAKCDYNILFVSQQIDGTITQKLVHHMVLMQTVCCPTNVELH